MAAIDAAASGQVGVGSVGAGTGTRAFCWKGGIGTASRVLPADCGGYTVGALVQSNFGGVLAIDGVPVGELLGCVPFGLAAEKPQSSAEGDSRGDGALCRRVGKPFFLLSVAMAGFIYAVSLLMLISPDVSARQELLERRKIDPLCSRSECESLVERVEQRLDGGAFLDPNLSLSDLAAQLQVHRNRLSFAINHSCQVPFRVLIT